MTVLHLGVIDLHYADAGSYPKAGARRPKRITTGSMTTGDVAEILEKKYGVMEHFWDKNGQWVIDSMTRSIVGAHEALYGGTVIRNPLGQATSQIENRFKQFITNREMDGVVPGVPTKAAMMGRSKRFARPYARRAERPSFVDTGLYRSSFKAWFE